MHACACMHPCMQCVHAMQCNACACMCRYACRHACGQIPVVKTCPQVAVCHMGLDNIWWQPSFRQLGKGGVHPWRDQPLICKLGGGHLSTGICPMPHPHEVTHQVGYFVGLVPAARSNPLGGLLGGLLRRTGFGYFVGYFVLCFLPEKRAAHP